MGNVSRPLVALLAGTLAFFALWTVALKPGGSSSHGSAPSPAALSSAVAKARQVSGASAAASAAESGAAASRAAPPTTPSTARAGNAGHDLGTVPAQPTGPGSAGHGLATVPSLSTGLGNAGHGLGAAPSPPTGAGTAATSVPGLGPATASAGAGGSQTWGAVGASAAPAVAASPSALRAALVAHQVVLLLFYNPAGADDQAVLQEVQALPTDAGVVVMSVPIDQLAQYSSVTEQVPVSQSPTLVFVDRHGEASEITGFADSMEISQRLAGTLAAR